MGIRCTINYDTFDTNKSKIALFYAIDNKINYVSQNKTIINIMINETIDLQIKWLQLLLLENCDDGAIGVQFGSNNGKIGVQLG